MQLSDTRFGIITWADPRTPVREIGDVAREAEAMGFSTLWVWDTPIYTKDAYVALTVAAQATEKIRLGPGVSNPLTRHISVIANSIATLDDLSEGRVVLGMGRGAPGSANAVGFPTESMARFRARLLDLRDLVSGQEVKVGESGGYRVLSVERRIPIFLSVWGPRMIEMAGQLADGALIAGPSDTEAMASKILRLRSAAEAAGRGTGEIEGHVQLTISWDDDPAAAIERVRPVVTYQFRRAPANWQKETPEALQDEVAAIRGAKSFGRSPSAGEGGLASDALVRHAAIVGSVGECQEQVREIVALGPEEVTFRLPAEDRMAMLKGLGEVVWGV